MKKLLLLLLVLFEVTLSAQAGVKISPILLEINANKNKRNFVTACINVKANKKETIRLKVYPKFFSITENGKMKVLSDTNTPNCLVSNTRFVPNEFTLKDGKTQKIRLTITNLKKLPDGESRMVLFLEDVVAKEIILPNNYKNVVTKLIVKTRIGVPVYVDKGKFIKVASFDNLKIEKNKKDLVYKVKMNSTGNCRVRCSGKGQIIKNGKLISEFKTDNLVMSSYSSFFKDQKLPLDKITEPGEYTLRMVLKYKDHKNKIKKLIKEVDFKVNELPTEKVVNIEKKETKAIKIAK